MWVFYILLYSMRILASLHFPKRIKICSLVTCKKIRLVTCVIIQKIFFTLILERCKQLYNICKYILIYPYQEHEASFVL